MLTNNLHEVDKTWTKAISSDDVVCYERRLNKCFYLEHRSSAVLDSSLEDVVEVLRDVTAYPEWMYECSEARLLKQDGELSKLIHCVLGLPRDAWHSDIIISARSLVDLNGSKMVITLKSVDDPDFKHPDLNTSHSCMRVTGFKGSWRLEELGKNSTLVDFTAHADLGMQAGEYLVNNMMHKLPHTPFVNLREKVKQVWHTQAEKQRHPQMRILETL
jgi:ribosome-associated toxin RatA of RatAB toxin-antitoxin module